MTCTGLWYTERDIVGRGLSITTMVVTFLCIRYSAIWRLGMGLRYGEVWGRTARFEGANLENYRKWHSIYANYGWDLLKYIVSEYVGHIVCV